MFSLGQMLTILGQSSLFSHADITINHLAARVAGLSRVPGHPWPLLHRRQPLASGLVSGCRRGLTSFCGDSPKVTLNNAETLSRRVLFKVCVKAHGADLVWNFGWDF